MASRTSGFHSLYPDYEIVPTFLHITYVFTTELSSVRDESVILVPIGYGIVSSRVLLYMYEMILSTMLSIISFSITKMNLSEDIYSRYHAPDPL